MVNKDENRCNVDSSSVSVNLEESGLSEGEKDKFKDFLSDFDEVFSDKPGLTHVAWNEINTGSATPVASKPHCYEKVKQAITDYQIKNMLVDDIIMPINSHFASHVVLCRKNNGKNIHNPEAWWFSINYRKLNAITQYPQYPIPVIDDILANITSTHFMSKLDLTSGYFQIGMKPEDIAKIVFITRNGCFAFNRMIFGYSGALSTFQKAMNTMLKPLIGKGVLVYLDDIIIIIMAATFEQHLRLFREVFTLKSIKGTTHGKFEKCNFLRNEIRYFGVRITEDGIKTDE